MASKIFQIRIRNKAVEVFQPDLILDYYYLMIGAQFQRVRLFAHRLVHCFKIADSLVKAFVHHFIEDCGKHLGVVRRTVVIEISERKVLCENIELVLLQIRIDISRHCNRIEIRICKAKAELVRSASDKACVESCIVSDKEAVSRKFEKFRKHFGNRRCIGNGFIADSRELGYVFRDMYSGIHKHIEFIYKLAGFHADRADLGNLAVKRRKTGRFNIKKYKLIVKGSVALSVQGARRIVNEVCFKSVKNLYIGVVLFLQVLSRQHGDRKSLEISVIRYRYRLMSERRSGLYDLIGL